MARNLQDRLALAKFKTEHGLENVKFPELEKSQKQKEDTRRKRVNRDGHLVSDSSSSSSSSSRRLNSSPLTAPLFSDDVGSQSGGGLPHMSFDSAFVRSGKSARKRSRSISMAAPTLTSLRSDWKSNYQLPGSSPIKQRRTSHFTNKLGPEVSFTSDISTIPDEASSYDAFSDNEETTPTRSFAQKTPILRSSPPRTPPPSRARAANMRKGRLATEEEGAELLVYLASPANAAIKGGAAPPMTPPSKHANLPSSMMSTPGGGNLFGSFNTPGQNFDFADFVNITPSPAQAAWANRTPRVLRTPIASQEARRRLNFDALVAPSTSSPQLNDSDKIRDGRDNGLNLQLGEDLLH